MYIQPCTTLNSSSSIVSADSVIANQITRLFPSIETTSPISLLGRVKKVLIEFCGNIGMSTFLLISPLFLTHIVYKRNECFEYLVKHGHSFISSLFIRELSSRLSFCSHDGRSLLNIAAETGNISALNILSRVSDWSQLSIREEHISSFTANRDPIEFLYTSVMAEEDFSLAIHIAAKNGHLDVVKYLVDHGFDSATLDEEGRSALHWAANNGHAETVEFLCRQEGIDLNHANLNSDTALMMAANNGHAETVEFLCGQEGIDINQANQAGNTALILAANNGHAETVDFLCGQEGIDLNHANQYGNTALMMAAYEGHRATVELLCGQTGIDVNHATQRGITALMMAAARGHTVTVELLCRQEGIELNSATHQGYTALMMAAGRGHTVMVELLCRQEGIELNHADLNGDTALGLAPSQRIIEVLEQYGASS